MDLLIPSFESLEQHSQLLFDSYFRLLQEPLLENTSSGSVAQLLFEAPFVLVSHTTDPEPVFNYGNANALALFEFNWDEFTQLPSKFSAEPVNQAAREALLSEVRRHGFIRNYQGVRISKSGRRFQITQAIVWNIWDREDLLCGQAACFKNWIDL